MYIHCVLRVRASLHLFTDVSISSRCSLRANCDIDAVVVKHRLRSAVVTMYLAWENVGSGKRSGFFHTSI